MRKITALTIAAAMMIATTVPVFAATTAQAPAAQTPAAQTTTVTASVTPEQALAIALQNAGLSEKEVVIVKNQLEFDDGILQYDIEFVKGQVEYEYDINATTGQILSTDRDFVHSVF